MLILTNFQQLTVKQDVSNCESNSIMLPSALVAGYIKSLGKQEIPVEREGNYNAVLCLFLWVAAHLSFLQGCCTCRGRLCVPQAFICSQAFLGKGKAFAFAIAKQRLRRSEEGPRSHRVLVVDKGIDPEFCLCTALYITPHFCSDYQAWKQGYINNEEKCCYISCPLWLADREKSAVFHPGIVICAKWINMQTHIHANIYTFYTRAQIIYVLHSRARKNKQTNLVSYISNHSCRVLLKTGMKEDNATS